MVVVLMNLLNGLAVGFLSLLVNLKTYRSKILQRRCQTPIIILSPPQKKVSDTGRIQEEAELYTAEGRVVVIHQLETTLACLHRGKCDDHHQGFFVFANVLSISIKHSRFLGLAEQDHQQFLLSSLL